MLLQLTEKERELAGVLRELQESKNGMAKAEESAEYRKRQLEQAKLKLKGMKEDLGNHKKEIEFREGQLATLEYTQKEKKKLQAKVASLADQMQAKDYELRQRDQVIEHYQTDIKKKDYEIQSQRSKINALYRKITSEAAKRQMQNEGQRENGTSCVLLTIFIFKVE